MDFDTTKAFGRVLSRRRALIWGGMAAAAGTVLAACGGAPASPTAAPKAAEPTKPAAAPAATTAPAAAPTTAPATKPTEAAKPAEPTKPAAAPAPAAKVAIKGKFTVLLVDDFHPDHNAAVKKWIEDYSKNQGWPLELAPVAGFLAGADIYQKLLATVQAGDPPDLMIHGLSARNLQTLNIGEPVNDIVDGFIKKYGKIMPGSEAANFFDNKWWAVPFYGRTGGHWARADVFKKAGIDIDKDLETWDQVREACLKVSDPANKMWGWGMTVNRSGDGESLVRNAMWQWGGTLTDETGEIVKLNSPETIAGMKWLAEVYLDKKWEKMLPPGVNAWNDFSNNEAFNAGTLAFTSNAGTMYAKAVFDKVPFASEIKVIPMPYGPPRKRLEGASTNNFYLFRGVKNKEASVAIITFLLDPEQQRTLWKISTGYVVPPFKSMWSDPIVQGDENNRRFERVAWNEPPFRGLAHPGPLTAAADAVGIQNVFTDMFGQILQGKKVEDAVKEAHDRCVKIYKEFGLKGA
jgi:multiple sugar transport system substrate-binding protein